MQKICCIYQITNLVNGKRYIGSTIDYTKRKKQHFNSLKGGYHCNSKLQKDFDQYGIENFEMIKTSLPCTEDTVRLYERAIIFSVEPEYNIVAFTGAGTTGRKMSEETRSKMSKARMNNQNRKGIPHTEETKREMSISRTGKKRSDSIKKEMSRKAIENNTASYFDYTKVIKKVIDQNGQVYESLTSAAKLNGISIQAVCNNLKGRNKLASIKKQLSFRYYEDSNEK